MEERGNRDQLVILTKGAHHDRQGPRVNPEAIDRDLFESLERLRTERIELYALHRDDPSVPVGPIIEALNAHIEAGRIGAIGGSNWTWQRLQEANEYAATHGLVGFTFRQSKPKPSQGERAVLAGLRFSGRRYACLARRASATALVVVFAGAWIFYRQVFARSARRCRSGAVFYSDANWERLRRAEQLAKEKGVTTIQIALAYVLNQPFPTCALIGARNPEELRSCEEGARIKLSPEETAWLDLTE